MVNLKAVRPADVVIISGAIANAVVIAAIVIYYILAG